LTNADTQSLSRDDMILNQDMADVEAVGIRQTPTFFLNGKCLENFSAETLIVDVRFAVENA